jgi:central glycolytic genes regulator
VTETNWTSLLQRMAPEVITVMENRYKVLRQIRLLQPVGRRMLAEVMQSTERVIRREVELLREQRLIDSNRAGMFVTPDGENIIEAFHPFWKEVGGISLLEQETARRLSIRKVLIVPGDADDSEWTKDDMARQAAAELTRVVTDDAVIAVAGGSSVMRMERYVQPSEDARNLTFVPARGALGDELDLESNTVTARIARKMDASYRLLHLPDVLEEQTLRNIQRDSIISDVLELIQSAKILVHGIGEAEEMSRRRGLSEDILRILREKRAVSEVFGYYFNGPGELVYRMNTVGMQMEHVHTLDEVIAIAGGKSKADAILSYIRNRDNYVLVTDEAAASRMIALLEGRE